MSGFYDTCVFELALNTSDRDHADCAALVDAGTITWPVSFSEISRAEAPFDEYLDRFLVQCIQNGVSCIEIKMDGIQATQRLHRDTKKALEYEGMQSRDIKQAFAARAANATILVTRDRDFNAPSLKSTKSKKASSGNVLKILRQELELLVAGPKEGLKALK
jgi:hypothetical protein